MSSHVTTDPGVRLCEILPNAQFVGSEDIVARSCCGQWDDCHPDDIFVAIVGSESDGHDFAHEAIERGAKAVVTERLLAIDQPQCIVPDTRNAYGKICQALAGNPCKRMSMIGVSGSDGKTVSSHLIRNVLTGAGNITGLISSIEVDLGRGRHSVPKLTPQSPWLAEQLGQMALSDCSHAIIEFSSVSLAQRALSGVDLDIAVLTNIRHDHLEFHGSIDNYRRAQMRMLKRLKPQGVAILNADDPVTHFLLDNCPVPAITIGFKQDAQVTARVIERCASEQTLMLKAGNDSVPIRTTTIGSQHVYHCLTAAAVGLALGMDLSQIAQGLRATEPIPGRMERVECGQPFHVWIDSARCPNQLSHAGQSVKQVTQGKLWCVVSIDDQHSEEDRKRVGQLTEQFADRVIITQNTSQPLTDYEMAHQILDGLQRPETARLIPNRFRAIEWALQNAQPEDSVLIAGCGEKPFALVGEDQWPIADRDVCQSWLYDHAPMSNWATPAGDDPEIFDITDYQ